MSGPEAAGAAGREAPGGAVPVSRGRTTRGVGPGGRKATPALMVLEQAGVSYQLETFQPDRVSTMIGEGYGLAAARALGADPDTIFKTLMVKIDGELWCAIIPVSRHLDFKAVARAAGGKKAALAAVTEAERATGYVVGGISPLGQRNRHQTVIDASAQRLPQIMVSAGGRGMDIRLDPYDLAHLTGALFAPIGRS